MTAGVAASFGSRLAGILAVFVSIGCGEPRFPTESARVATIIRVNETREITERRALDDIVRIAGHYASWEAVPECGARMTDDVRLEWLVDGAVEAAMSLDRGGRTARSGYGTGPPCGRLVPEDESKALFALLDLRG